MALASAGGAASRELGGRTAPACGMYEKFYGLAEPPFNLTPDPRFLFLGQRHSEALATLLYGVRQRKGFTLLTGEIGSGKTTLCRALLDELARSGGRVALILNSFISEIELLEAINEELGIESSGRSRKSLFDALKRYLLEQQAQGRIVAALIDEAQNLSEGVLEQVRMLGNLETANEKLLQLVLVGQPELQRALLDPKLEQLNQRIAVRCHLRPLDRDETEAYIRHRLRVAGLSTPLEFLPGAIDVIYEYTEGVPRKINLLCDRALLAGYVASTYTIDDAVIRSAAIEVGADQWAPTTEPPARGKVVAKGHRRLSTTTLLYALALVVALAMAPVLLTESGLLRYWFGRPRAENPGRPAGIAPLLTTASLTEMIPPAERDTAAKPAAMEAAPQGEDEPASETFRLVEPKPADPWTYDEDFVVRVDRPEFCKTAAILTLLGAWGIEVNLEDFRDLSPQEASKLDVIEANRDKGLRSVEVRGGLRRALTYDLPLVVRIADPSGQLSDYIVLLEVERRMCRIADPMLGIQKVPRAMLEPMWRKAWVVYFDLDNLDGLALGQRSERARLLQQTLLDLGFYRGPLTGEFDRATVEAVKNLQRYFDIFPTGRLDPLTVMLLATHSQPDRPHLAPTEEPAQ